MKRISFLFLIISLAGCSPKIVDGLRWQSRQIKVDGLSDDWNLPLQYFDGNSGMNYEFSNNKENLYFAIRITDKNVQQQVLFSGLVVELDTVKNSVYSYGVKFPVNKSPAHGSGARPMPDNNQEKQMGERIDRPQMPDKPEQDKNLTFEGFFPENIMIRGFDGNEDEEVVVPNQETNPLKVSINSDENGVMFCEGSIPFKSINRKSLSAKDTLKTIFLKISLEKGDMPAGTEAPGGSSSKPAPSQQRGGNSGGDGPPGGGPGGDFEGGPGGGPGGRPGGSGEMDGPPDQQESTNNDKPYEIELKCRFSLKD